MTTVLEAHFNSFSLPFCIDSEGEGERDDRHLR